MFAYFPNAVGVANVREFADRMATLPAYVTRLEAGAGFAELADFLLGRSGAFGGDQVPLGSVASLLRYAFFRSWFLSGRLRMRLPVAAKIALSTAGAATAIVGSPTPPQNPPDGITIVSTAGISSIRSTR